MPLRVLVVSPFAPLPSWGGGSRVFNLARCLAKRNNVTLLTYARKEELERESEHFRALCSTCQVHVVPQRPQDGLAGRASQLVSLVSPTPHVLRSLHTPAMQAALDGLCQRVPFDVVLVEFSHMCSYRTPSSAALVLDEHNIEYEVLQRTQNTETSFLRRVYNGQEHLKVRWSEQRLWRQVDACAVTSDREELIVRQHAPHTRTAVVPNGVDIAFFAPQNTEPEPQSIVFTGLLKYRPNLDGARYLVEEILPEVERVLPGIHVTIVGQGSEADLASLRRPNVLVTGWVPDVRPYIARAAVVVTPLRIGSGTRLKVLEALAMAKPTVSTAVGCEGINVRDRAHLLVADDPVAFAQSIVELLSDPVAASAMGERGRSLILDQYSWEGAALRLEALFARVAGGTRAQ